MNAVDEIVFFLNANSISPHRELRFHPTRRWRFDLAVPSLMLAIEIDGGVYKGGRHTSGAGFTRDCEKVNEATILGWRVLRFTTGQVRNGYAFDAIERMLEKINHE
jgi:very-short-patch-repair endonuclease